MNKIDTTRKMTTAYKISLFFISFRFITSSTLFENVSSPFTRLTCDLSVTSVAYVFVCTLQLLALRMQVQFDITCDVVDLKPHTPRILQTVVL